MMLGGANETSLIAEMLKENAKFGEFPEPSATPTFVFRYDFCGPCQKQAVYHF